MQALKAQVRNGRITLDEPTDLPDGDIYLLPIGGDDLGDEGLAEAREGRHEDAAVVMARLRERRENPVVMAKYSYASFGRVYRISRDDSPVTANLRSWVRVRSAPCYCQRGAGRIPFASRTGHREPCSPAAARRAPS